MTATDFYLSARYLNALKLGHKEGYVAHPCYHYQSLVLIGYWVSKDGVTGHCVTLEGECDCAARDFHAAYCKHLALATEHLRAQRAPTPVPEPLMMAYPSQAARLTR